jgi:uncharacterized membrane protein YgdD (TMEM256/DUF423 family)
MAVAILIALAGLMGAAGIVLAAAGAHVAPGAGLDSAASIFLFHAAAVVGGAALIQQGALWRPLALAVLAAWVLGAVLFSGDIALRAFHRASAVSVCRAVRRLYLDRRLAGAGGCGFAAGLILRLSSDHDLATFAGFVGSGQRLPNQT